MAPFQKKLYWKQLDIQDAEGTIFSEVDSERRKTTSAVIDINALQRMFQGESAKATERTRRSSGVLNKAAQRNMGLKLLSDHRARNIAIILKRLPTSTRDLSKILCHLKWEASELATDDLEQVLEVIPTKEEAEKLREHKDPEALVKLRDVEQMLVPLAMLSRCAARVRLLCIARGARTQFKTTARSLASIRAACSAIQRSAALKEVMLLALQLGNYINNGDRSKGAKAITVGSLMTLKDFKTGRMSSLHFLCASLLRADTKRDCADVLARELRPAERISNLQVSNLQGAMRTVQRDFEVVAAECQNFLQEYEGSDDSGKPVGSDEDLANEDSDETDSEPESKSAAGPSPGGSRAAASSPGDSGCVDVPHGPQTVEDATRWVEDVLKIRGSASKRLQCMKQVVEKLCSLMRADMEATAEQAYATLRFCGMPMKGNKEVPIEFEALLQQLAEFIKVFKSHWDEVHKDLASYQQLFGSPQKES
eukprot:TRINITY_DN3163_c1_g2_i2.p1 TRINITY_DN3163_c1_g2~~TRINITY_DN3163_c1_g2_i2.p1  ORF type:complete len:481 (-),score=120.38 TRINITY_DN3163_c1_g2_i2:150-1592(-)